METKQLNGYNIDFIDGDEYDQLPMYQDRTWLADKVYVGNVDGISEELADKIVDAYTDTKGNIAFYENYSNTYRECKTAKESFQTLSTLPYCVINKINE